MLLLWSAYEFILLNIWHKGKCNNSLISLFHNIPYTILKESNNGSLEKTLNVIKYRILLMLIKYCLLIPYFCYKGALKFITYFILILVLLAMIKFSSGVIVYVLLPGVIVYDVISPLVQYSIKHCRNIVFRKPFGNRL